MTGRTRLTLPASRIARLLRRIAIDNRGNTLAIIGAALIPLMAMIGSGIDMSRAYMTKARLQQACDAGVLAGRAAMTGTTFTDTAKTQAEKYFDFNFPTNAFGSNTIVRTFSDGGRGQVDGTASTVLPTGVMQLFGIKSMDLAVTCKAKLDFVNTDVVLVLDTTGSMIDNNLDTGETRLAGLQDAVGDLYDTLEPIGRDLHSRNLRLRYGVIPYSSTVNVGKLLYKRNASYIRNPYEYYQCTTRSGTTCTAATLKTVTQSSVWFTNVWTGCIRARATSDTITASTTSIPTAAKDMTINLLPVGTDTSTQWQPHDSLLDTSWQTQTTAKLTKSFTSCPSEARDLAEYYDAEGSSAKRTDFLNYINGLDAGGGTYHDVGMIWGAQMIAPEQGVFNVPLPGEPAGNRNPKSYNDIGVNRHIIFMTDGIMDSSGVSTERYTMYGTEKFTKATIGTKSSELIARHKQRFALMCSAAKSMGVEIWVIQFEEDATESTLEDCASGADHYARVTGKQQLIDQFVKIGKAIGALRLTK